MKIRAKLLGLVLSILAVVVISIVAYLVLSLPARKMNEERLLLNELRNSIAAEHSSVVKIILLKPEDQFERFTEAVARSNEILTRVEEEVTVLPRLSDEFARSLEIVKGLKQLQTDRQAAFTESLQNTTEVMKEIFPFASNQSIIAFTGTDTAIRHSQFNKLRQQTQYLMSSIAIAESTLESTLDSMDAQFDLIDREIEAINRRNLLVGGGMVLLLVGLVLIASTITARGITASLNLIGENMLLLEAKDLTKPFRKRSRDEIGELSDSLNAFLTGLRENMRQISNETATILTVKDELIRRAEETEEFTSEIKQSAGGIESEAAVLDRSIQAVREQSDEITSSILDLDGQIEQQMSMVEESTASITEMIASVGNMNKVTATNLSSADDLVKTAQAGGERIEGLIKRIEEMEERISQIMGMAGLIQGISSQTNMLAMNAAIEAAHAGEYGRGFAVVAGEIRNLAEASAGSSKEISQRLKEIVNGISELTEESKTSGQAFKAVDTGIHELTGSLREISTGMSELDQGGKQILDAMNTLSEVSTKVHSRSEGIQQSSGQIGKQIGAVGDVSSSLKENVGLIAEGLTKIQDSMNQLNGMNQQLGAVSSNLQGEIDSFTIDEDIEPQDKSHS